MDASADVLAEKQERALRQREQLTVLRRAGRIGWHDWAYLAVGFLIPVGLIYRVHFDPISKEWLFMNAVLAAWALISLVAFIVKPMRCRIDALERLLEAELGRNPPR